jgi:hypothetical protein
MAWDPPRKTLPVPWQAVEALPLAAYEARDKDFSDVDDWTARAMAFKLEPADVQASTPEQASALFRLMQLLLYSIEFDARNIFSQLETVQAELRATKSAAARASTGTADLEHQRDEALAEVRRLVSLIERHESDNTLLRQETHQLRQDVQKQTKARERAETAAAAAEINVKRLETDLDVLKQSSQTQRREASSLVKESTEASLMLQRLAEQVRDYKLELDSERDRCRKVEEACRMEVKAVQQRAQEMELNVVGLQEDIAQANAAREAAELAVAEVERNALKDMETLRSLHDAMVAQERRSADELREELATAKHDLAVEQSLGRGDSSAAPHAKIREELARKDSLIAQLRDALDEATRENEFGGGQSAVMGGSRGVSGGGGGGGAFGTLTAREGQELFSLRQEVVKLERESDETGAELDKTRKLLAMYRDKDKSVEEYYNKLETEKRAREALEAVNEQLQERLNTHDDLIDYCENLRALCGQLGATQADLDELNVRGARTEIEVLRQKVHNLEEEQQWMEQDRKYWISRVRLQPLLQAKLRIELGLTAEQMKVADEIVAKMRRDEYEGADTVEQRNEDFREKFLEERRLRLKDQEDFNGVVAKRLEEGVQRFLGGNPMSASAGGGGIVSGAVAFTQEALQQLRDEIRAMLPQRAGLGTTGTGEDVDSLRQAIVEQTRLVKSQSEQLQQLELSLKDRFEEVLQHRNRTLRAEEEAREAVEERDRYREVLAGRADPSASYTAAVTATAPTPLRAGGSHLHLHAPSPMRQSSLHLLNSSIAGSGLGGSQRLVAPDNTALDHMIAIEHGLRKQLQSKDIAIAALEQRVRDSERVASEERNKCSAAERIVEHKDREIAAHERNEADLSAVLEATSARAEELEKVKTDLMATAGDKRLLQKIVDLRSRESKLLTRVRLLHREREMAVRAVERLEVQTAERLDDLRDAMSGERLPCLPHHGARQTEEGMLVSFVQNALTQLHKGQLLESDKAVVDEMAAMCASIAEQQTTFVATTEIAAVRSELEQYKDRFLNTDAELQALKSKFSAGSSSTGEGTLTSPSAKSKAELEVESETWRLKCGMLASRLSDKEREIAELDAQLAASRGDLAEVRGQYARRTEGDVGHDGAATTTATGSSSSPDGANVAQYQATRLLEQEVARLKSSNLVLLHSIIDNHAERRRLDADLKSTTTQLHLLTEQARPVHERAVELVARTMAENTALRQELALASSQAKSCRLRATAAEANVRILANEAGAYKLSAFRLYNQYVDHAVGIAQQCRAIYRQRDGALTLRASKEVHLRMARLAERVKSVEHLHHGAIGTCAELQAQLRSAHGDVALMESALQHVADHNNAATSGADAAAAAAARRRGSEPVNATREALAASLQRSRAVMDRGSVESVRTQQLAELRASTRVMERQLAESNEENAFVLARLGRSEEFASNVIKALTKLEMLGGVAGSPFGSDDAEFFLTKLMDLRDTVHAKSMAPPIAVDFSRNSSTKSGDEDETLKQYHDALMQHANLVKERGELTANIVTMRQQLSMLDARCGALKEELSHSEQRSAEAIRMLNDEKAKAQRREERISNAHAEQRRVMASATEHNVRCLREVITNKERVIEQLQRQLESDRNRHLESSLLDSTRLERLHDQLHRETASLVERFRQAVDSGRTANMPADDSSVFGTLREALQASCEREAALQSEVRMLRERTSELQLLLRAHTTAPMPPMTAPTSAATMQTSILPGHAHPAAAFGTSAAMQTSAAAAAGGQPPSPHGFAASQSLGGGAPPPPAAAPPTPTTGATTPLITALSEKRPSAVPVAHTGVQCMLLNADSAQRPASPTRVPALNVHGVPRVQADASSRPSLRAQDRTEAEWVAVKSALDSRDEEVRKLTKELRRAEREIERQKAKATTVLKLNAPPPPPSAAPSAPPAPLPPRSENVPPPASKGATAPEASKASKELKERLAAAEKRLADETAASAAKDAMHRREHIEALELQSALERQITALTKELHHLKRKAAQPPASSPKPLTTDQDTATAAAAAGAPGTSTGAQVSAISLAAAVPPLAVTDEQLRTPSPSQGSNAMARIKVLERQLAEANAKLSAQALLHRKEISRLFEERKQMEVLMLQSGRDKSPGTRLLTAAEDGAATAGTGGVTSRRASATAAAAAATGGGGAAGASSSRTGATRMRAEAQAAATEVLLREQIAKLQRDVVSKQTEADKVRTRDARSRRSGPRPTSTARRHRTC